MSQLGGRSACYDAAATMEAMCCAPEGDIANGACAALLAAGGPKHMVKVGHGRKPEGRQGPRQGTCRAPGSNLRGYKDHTRTQQDFAPGRPPIPEARFQVRHSCALSP